MGMGNSARAYIKSGTLEHLCVDFYLHQLLVKQSMEMKCQILNALQHNQVANKCATTNFHR